MQLTFIVDVPRVPAAVAPSDLSHIGRQLAELVRKDIPVHDRSKFVSATASDTPARAVTITDVVNPTNALTTLKRVSQAGGAAGSTVVSGALATSVLLAVFASDDTTHAVTDETAEWVANPATAGHFDNTGGTNNTGKHVIFVFYNPLAVGAGA